MKQQRLDIYQELINCFCDRALRNTFKRCYELMGSAVHLC